MKPSSQIGVSIMRPRDLIIWNGIVPRTMIVTAIILAGGVGERFGTEVPKQFVKLSGKPIIGHTLDIFEGNPSIDHVVVVVNRRYLEQTRSLVSEYGLQKVRAVVPGGATRQASSFEGLKACPEGTTHVLIHDAVRPFVDDDIIDRCVSSFQEHQAVDVCLESTDTIVEIDGNQDISGIPLRSTLRRGQTPQGFQLSIIIKAHQLALEEGFTDSTDDCNLLVRSKLAPVHAIDDIIDIRLLYGNGETGVGMILSVTTITCLA